MYMKKNRKCKNDEIQYATANKKARTRSEYVAMNAIKKQLSEVNTELLGTLKNIDPPHRIRMMVMMMIMLTMIMLTMIMMKMMKIKKNDDEDNADDDDDE